MVITQKYRFIADLLTAWEANGYAMGVDQQLKIRELLQKIPDECTIAELKTLLSPIFAHNAKQQEEFYDLFTKLDPQQKQRETNSEIQEQALPYPTSDLSLRGTKQSNPTSNIPSVFRLRNKRFWWSIGIGVVSVVVLILFFWKIVQFLFPKLPDTYKYADLSYHPDTKNTYTFNFDTLTPPLKDLDLRYRTPFKGLKVNITKAINKSPAFTIKMDSMPKEVVQTQDTLTFLFTYNNNEKQKVHYVFRITDFSSVSRITGEKTTNFDLKKYNHAVDTATLVSKETFQFSPSWNNWSRPKTGLWALFGAIIWGIAYWRRQKEKKDLAARRDNKTKPPYSWQIKIDGIENTIQLNDTFFRTANEMRRRSEMDIRRLDMPRTIQGTIKKAGMPQFSYRQPTQANEYLVLIDQAAAQSHRARLFDFLMRRWQQQEVLVERFFFNGDIRLCWNEKYQRGLSIAELQQRFPTHRLIVVGHGFWLLKTMVVEWDEWTAGLLDSWRYKVLLTPRMPSEWDARETVLSKKFRILPAILRGVGDLAETLDAVDIPNFKRWQELELEEAEPIRLPKKLSAETLMIFLETYFITSTQGSKRDDRLLQWIAACAVSPVIHWDLTLVSGQLIAKNNPEMDSLVTLDSIFQLTRLSWFNDAAIPDEARRPLLDWLEKTHPSVLAQVRAKWAEILTTNKPPEDSIAFDDYSLAVTINALNQKPTSRQKRKLNEDLERSLANEPRQDFLVLDYLAAQRTPLDAFIPQRFLNYFRDPERRIPTLRAWVWQIPLWVLGGLILFGFNYSSNCKEAVAMTSTRMACIQSPQDKLTLLEYAICDVLDKQYRNTATVQIDSVLALTYFVQNSRDVGDSERLDEFLLSTAKEMIERDNLDSLSFYRNLKIAYANAAIRYANKNNKDSACLYVHLYANLQTQDSVLTTEEQNVFSQLCSPQQKTVIDNTSFASQNRVPRVVTKIPEPNKPIKTIPQKQEVTKPNGTQDGGNANNTPNQNTVPAYPKPKQDSTQQQKVKLEDILSVSISGMQKDVVAVGESLNINYAVSNDGKEVIRNLVLTFELEGGQNLAQIKIDAIAVGDTKRGVQTVTIPKDAPRGAKNISIRAEGQGGYVQSNSKKIEIITPKGGSKK